MKKILPFLTCSCLLFSFFSHAQIKYGYTVLYARCGGDDSQRDKVYFSPIIELDRLNFPKFTDGVDPAIPRLSIRYYNYAIAKWFEIYLKDKYRIAVNDPEKYERNATSMVYDTTGNCNADKTEPGCFFTDKEKLTLVRKNAMEEAKQASNHRAFCEVVSL